METPRSSDETGKNQTQTFDFYELHSLVEKCMREEVRKKTKMLEPSESSERQELRNHIFELEQSAQNTLHELYDALMSVQDLSFLDTHEIVSDVGFEPTLTSPTQFEVARLLPQEEYERRMKYGDRRGFQHFSISGDDIVSRAINELHTNLGLQHAKWFIEHQKDIPIEWRKHPLVFTGTVLESRHIRYFPALWWNTGIWSGGYWRLYLTHYEFNDWRIFDSLLRFRT